MVESEDAFFRNQNESNVSTQVENGIVTLQIEQQRFQILDLMYKLLMQHQKQALAWLLEQHVRGNGSILADEMGLGKTITTISLIYTLHLTAKRANKHVGPCLIVCPATVIN